MKTSWKKLIILAAFSAGVLSVSGTAFAVEAPAMHHHDGPLGTIQSRYRYHGHYYAYRYHGHYYNYRYQRHGKWYYR